MLFQTSKNYLTLQGILLYLNLLLLNTTNCDQQFKSMSQPLCPVEFQLLFYASVSPPHKYLELVIAPFIFAVLLPCKSADTYNCLAANLR